MRASGLPVTDHSIPRLHKRQVVGVFAVMLACAVFTAMLYGAIASLFVPWGLPALTLPFCFGTLAFVLIKGASTTLEAVEVEDITTPEEHLARSRAARSGDASPRVAVPA